MENKKQGQEITPGGSVVHRYPDAEWAPTQIGAPSDSVIGFRKCRDEVYERRFGEPKSVSDEIITTLIPHVDVVEFYRVNKDGQRTCTLVTSGMSDLAMNAPPKAEARRVELIFYCNEPQQEYIDTMRWLAHFPHDQNTWLGPFHTMTNGDPPIPYWGSSVLDTFWFLPSIVKQDATLQDELILDGEGVQFLWIVPITTAERSLKLQKGSNALLHVLSEKHHPHVFDPTRKSYV